MKATWNTPHVYEQHGFTYRPSEHGFDVFYGDTRIAHHVLECRIFAAIVRFGDAMSRD